MKIKINKHFAFLFVYEFESEVIHKTVVKMSCSKEFSSQKPKNSVSKTPQSSRKCRSYSPSFKKQVINAVKEAGAKVNKGEISMRFGIPRSTLSTFLKNQNDLQLRTDCGDMSRKRKKGVAHPDVENATLQFFKQCRNENISISGPIL